MRKILLAGVALGGLVSVSLPAFATPLAGRSISNVIVGGTAYTVNFFDAALANVPAPQSTFTTLAQANSAISAITSSAQYSTLIASANQSSNPSSYYVGLIVPYNTTLFGTPAQYVGAIGTTGTSGATNLYYNASSDPNTNGNYTVVGYTVAQFATAVPEPASIAVVALGLFGLGWARRRVS